jgi:hypothetical protein
VDAKEAKGGDEGYARSGREVSLLNPNELRESLMQVKLLVA